MCYGCLEAVSEYLNTLTLDCPSTIFHLTTKYSQCERVALPPRNYSSILYLTFFIFRIVYGNSNPQQSLLGDSNSPFVLTEVGLTPA